MRITLLFFTIALTAPLLAKGDSPMNRPNETPTASSDQSRQGEFNEKAGRARLCPRLGVTDEAHHAMAPLARTTKLRGAPRLCSQAHVSFEKNRSF